MQAAAKNYNMKKSSILLVVFSVLFGAGSGVMGTRIYTWNKLRQSQEYAYEFEVISLNKAEWLKFAGEDTVLKFDSYTIKNGNRVRDGNSFRWMPLLGDEEFSVYKDGSLIGVERRRINP